MSSDATEQLHELAGGKKKENKKFQVPGLQLEEVWQSNHATHTVWKNLYREARPVFKGLRSHTELSILYGGRRREGCGANRAA